MIVNTIKLYKTPLSSDYKNVITLDQIFEVRDNVIPYTYGYMLDEVFSENRYLLENLNRSIKINNKLSSLTLPVKYETIRNYNYCAINNYFFFITSLISENDNENNPSCTITIKWDAWANNLDNLYYIDNNYNLKPKDVYSYITCKHHKRFNKIDGNISPIYFTNRYEKQETEKRLEYKERYEILFGKAILTDLTELKSYYNYQEFGGTQVTSSGNVTVFPLKTKYILYFPIAVYDNIDKIYKPFYTNTGGIWASITYGVDEITQGELETGLVKINNVDNLGNLNFQINNKITSYIADLRFTFYSPVKYIISVNEDIYVKFNKNPSRLVNSLFNVNDTYAFVYPTETTLANGDFARPTNIYLIDEKDLLQEKTIEFSYNELFETEVPQYLWVIDNENQEPMLKTYPFNYLSYIVNEEEHIISPNTQNFDKFGFDFNLKSYQPKYTIYRKEDTAKKYYINQYGEFINNSGSITYSRDALDDYLIRNGSQEKAQRYIGNIRDQIGTIFDVSKTIPYFNSGASGISSLFSSVENGVNRAINIAGRDIMIHSKHTDLGNTPSMLIASNYGEDDIYFQDRLVFVINKMVKNERYYCILNNLFLYGYEDLIINNPLLDNRVYFDFVKTENLDLNIIPNYDDRKELEIAFNNGVFKNHYYYSEIEDIPAISSNEYLLTCIKDVNKLNNMELELI